MQVDDMDEELRGLREAITVPPIDPARARALMAGFDAHWAKPAWRRVSWGWATAAAVPVLLALVLGAVVVRDLATVTPPAPIPPPLQQTTVEPPAPGVFVPWPGSHALPPFEGGELRQVEIPVSSLPELGLVVPANATSIVKVEVVVGHDGFRRAVRLAQ